MEKQDFFQDYKEMKMIDNWVINKCSIEEMKKFFKCEKQKGNFKRFKVFMEAFAVYLLIIKSYGEIEHYFNGKTLTDLEEDNGTIFGKIKQKISDHFICIFMSSMAMVTVIYIICNVLI